MIRVEISKKNNVIESIHCIGHAGYADYGKDIVCASCSSILITTVNAILSIDKDAINYQDKKDFEMNVLKDDEFTDFTKLYLISSKLLLEFHASLSIQTYEYVKNLCVSMSSFIVSISEPVISLINSANLLTSLNVFVCKYILS